MQFAGLGVTLPRNWNLRTSGEVRAPDVRDLAGLITQCRMRKSLVIELARFVRDLLHRRERLYRFCIARDSHRLPTPLQTG